MPGDAKTATTIVNILCEFVEIVFHNILHTRKLYPETIFERKRKYGVVVYHSIHPDVNEYITECVKAINFHLKKNQLKNIFLCFHSYGKIVEKYNIELVNLGQSLDSDPFLVKLEQYLRDFCLKLHSATNSLDSLPDESTFSIQLNVTKYSNLEFNQDPSNEDFPWICLSNSECNLPSSEIVPLHTIETEFLNLQIYIEKSAD